MLTRTPRTSTIVIGLGTLLAVGIFVATALDALMFSNDLGGGSGASGFLGVRSLADRTRGASPSSLPPSPSSLESNFIPRPERLRIPRIGVDANVQQVGRNGRGDMAVPSNFTDVAWYREGPKPGARGSAVIAGHVDNGLGLPGVFKDLSTLRKGDRISVLREDGSSVSFVVSDIGVYPFDAAPLDRIFGADDRERLNLITCVGKWLPDLKTYDQRLIVYAQSAEDPS